MELILPDPRKATLELGFAYIKKGDMKKALEALNGLLEDDPYLAQAYWGRALCLEFGAKTPDDLRAAVVDYGKSIVYSREPSALSYGRRGILYFKLKMYDEALGDFAKALRSDFLWTEVLFYRGRTYLALSRGTDDARLAEADFADVARNSQQPFAPAHFWRAQALRKLGRDAEAVGDYRRALEIDPDDVLALNALAYCAEHGIGINADRALAEELYEKAAGLGFVPAQKNLAWLYAGDGNGHGEDARLSAYWMQRAALAGDAEALNLYGLRLLHGKGVEPNPHRAKYYFELSYSHGYLPAVCNLAECYEHGVGVPEPAPGRAFEIYAEAAEKGSESAKYHVGRHYYFGIGAPEDNDKAFNTLKPLADGGHARAQDIIGMCYESGYGAGQNQRLAGKYYRLAYEQGHAHAAAHLASRYRAGRGVKRNLAEAARLYTEAGERGSSYAWYALGRLYFEDKRDFGKAADAFRKARDAGEAGAASWLACSLMRGKNAKSNAHKAYRILSACVENNEPDALNAAVLLSRFEFYGFLGWDMNPEAAAARLSALLPAVDASPPDAVCAYTSLAQAYELGAGPLFAKNESHAARMYARAAETGRAGCACRCFVAGMAHVLFRGIGREPDPEAADAILETEMRESPLYPDSEVCLLYLWSKRRTQTEYDVEALARAAKSLLAEDPHDVLAAYLQYYLDKDSPNAKKSMSRLERLMRTASPYHAFMIRAQLEAAPDEIMYPIITADVADAYRKFRQE